MARMSRILNKYQLQLFEKVFTNVCRPFQWSAVARSSEKCKQLSAPGGGKAVDTDYPPEWPVTVQNENEYKQISDPDV